MLQVVFISWRRSLSHVVLAATTHVDALHHGRVDEGEASSAGAVRFHVRERVERVILGIGFRTSSCN